MVILLLGYSAYRIVASNDIVFEDKSLFGKFLRWVLDQQLMKPFEFLRLILQ